MRDDILARIRSVDWTDKSEAAISSQLITPVLHLLGYGEHTLHKFVEQRSYPLKDPTVSKGSRRVKLDYQPSVYEEGLWVMEAKGTDAKVTPKTLGQVRDYAIHPEIRAALMVTVDAAGFRVFDPWDEYWAEPLVTVAVNDVPDRIDELRAVLGVDRVADFVRKRHFDHLRRALSASLEFGVLTDAEREFRGLIREARDAIDTKRSEIHRQARADAEALHERVLKNSGIWGVAQHNNTPWIGAPREWKDFATAADSDHAGMAGDRGGVPQPRAGRSPAPPTAVVAACRRAGRMHSAPGSAVVRAVRDRHRPAGTARLSARVSRRPCRRSVLALSARRDSAHSPHSGLGASGRTLYRGPRSPFT